MIQKYGILKLISKYRIKSWIFSYQKTFAQHREIWVSRQSTRKINHENVIINLQSMTRTRDVSELQSTCSYRKNNCSSFQVIRKYKLTLKCIYQNCDNCMYFVHNLTLKTWDSHTLYHPYQPWLWIYLECWHSSWFMEFIYRYFGSVMTNSS